MSCVRFHFHKTRLLMRIFVVLVLVLVGFGCKGPQCERLAQCCEASGDLPGVGEACKLSQNVANEEKCGEIANTLVYMYTQKKIEVPAVCQETKP